MASFKLREYSSTNMALIAVCWEAGRQVGDKWVSFSPGDHRDDANGNIVAFIGLRPAPNRTMFEFKFPPDMTTEEAAAQVAVSYRLGLFPDQEEMEIIGRIIRTNK